MTKTLAAPNRTAIAVQVQKIVHSTPIFDVHTHLYDPALGELLLWGIDDLLIYHYLVAEVFRFAPVPYDKFWAMSKTEQADLVWQYLFKENSPISEACRGVLNTLRLLGLDVKKRDLAAVRQWFSNWKPDDYVTHCMELAGVRNIAMTNSPFDDLERPAWEKGFARDERFTAALRIDPLLLSWKETASRLRDWNYEVNADLNEKTISAIRKFLGDWTRRLNAKYLMISLPPDFQYPAATECAQLIERAVLPHCREFGLPFALMMGVKRAVNPQLRMAGDGSGLCRLEALSNLCAQHSENRFLVTVLARENQHELCVLARKFRNLHIFGCWWFMNIPHLVDEITRMRVELLGLSFTPQHSDARILDQIVYKWHHSRSMIAQVLADKYADLAETGWEVSSAEMERDAQQLFGGAFEAFCRGR